MRSSVTSQDTLDLWVFIDALLERLVSGRPLPRSAAARKTWRSYWGKRAYADRVLAADLLRSTEKRKQYLECLFGHARKAVKKAVETDVGKAQVLRKQLATRRSKMPSHVIAAALAIEAALDLVWLETHTKENNRTLRLALCFCAFGDIAAVIHAYARELHDLFRNVSADLQICAVAGMDAPPIMPAAMDSVRVHSRSIDLAELVTFPGIKAPGLIGACVDAVDQDVDLVVTIDGDARLPLFEIIPAVAALLKSAETDAALGSRRVPGALVSKPGLRHLTSVANACYVDVLMRPVLGHIHDPQAIFKVYRASRLAHSLGRLGYDRANGWSLSELQDGSLACELLLANLAADGRRPHLVEVPAVETMAYPASPRRMAILASGHIKGMIAAANRPRRAARERPLLGEGTEVLAIRQPHGDVVKVPRAPERPAIRRPVPISKVTDNRLLWSALSWGGAIRTLVYGVAGRSHHDRGFGISPAAIELIDDERPAVKEFLPAGITYEYLDQAFRLPFSSAVIVKTFWRMDRFLWAGGDLLAWIGMRPPIVVRMIGAGARLARLIGRFLRAIVRPMKTIACRAASYILRTYDLLAAVMRRCARRITTVLEVAGALRVFAAADHLDQRSRLCHAILRGSLRVLLECRWLLESFNVSVSFGRPLLCVVQRQPIRPFWSVLSGVDVSMTVEIQQLLEKALTVYRALGEAGYYDGELSLDNLGFVIEGNRARAVVMDYGSVVAARHCLPALVLKWLRGIRDDYEKSFAVYKLRRYAQGNRDAERVVEIYIRQSLELVETWITHLATFG